jgi:hypothetical protein
MSVGMRILTGGRFEEEVFHFTLSTDQGAVGLTARLYALPSHQFNPASVTLKALVGDEAGSFDLVHREVYPQDKPRAAGWILVPPALSATQIGSRAGRVAGAPEFAYEDTTYKVKIVDPSFGLHREELVVKEEGDKTLATAPVVWERVEYLSTSPRRVYLSSAPQRVFLRCPDLSVELTRVRGEVPGVKAVISSTREVTLALTKQAPPVIDGAVEIETTAKGRPPLRIPVVRYSPPPRRVDAGSPRS